MSLSNDIDLFELLNNPNPQIYKDLTEEFFNIEQQSIEFVKYTLAPWV